MFAKFKATQELQLMLDKYREELHCCTDRDEKQELIEVVENLEWIIKELEGSDDDAKSKKTKWAKV